MMKTETARIAMTIAMMRAEAEIKGFPNMLKVLSKANELLMNGNQDAAAALVERVLENQEKQKAKT